MKRLIALVLFLMCLFSLTALAQSIPEQVQAPERVEETYQSPTGRTTVSLDAQVVVPQVEAMPLVEVFPRVFEPAEVRTLADHLLGKGAWQAIIHFGRDKEQMDTSPEPGYDANTDDALGVSHRITLGGGGTDVNGLFLKLLSAGYRELGGPGGPTVFTNLQYQYKDGDNLGRHVGTREAAVALAEAAVQLIWPEMHVYGVDKDLDLNVHRTSRIGKPADYGYRIYFARRLNQVPVTPVMQQGAGEVNYFFKDKPQPSYQMPIPYESLFVDVGEDGIFQIRYDNPLQIGELLEAKTNLLPFEQILDIFGKVGPLKYAAYESNENNGIQINQVVLGYMHLQMKDKPSRYQMVPVWDFFGTRTIGEERYDFANDALFTINALDGTVIDRELGY